MADGASKGPPLAWAWGDPGQKAAWRRYWVHDTAHGLIGLALHYGVKPLPLPLLSAIGAWAGRALGPRRGPAWDKRARANFARLRPDLDVDAATRAMWGNIGRSMIEFSALRRLWRGRRSRYIGLEHLRAVQQTGRPRIMIFLHIGNWELPGPLAILAGEPIFQFYQPPRNRFERFIARRARRSLGHRLLLPNAADTLRGMRMLASGEATLSIAVDEFIRGRVQGPYFGRPHRLDGNIGFAARMAIKTGAILIPAYAKRVEGADFEMHFEPPIEVVAGETAAATLAATADAINAAIEPIVLAHLDQWLMIHDLRFDQD